MRILQVANFSAAGHAAVPTAGDQWRAGYAAAGHGTAVVVPGARDSERMTSSGLRVGVRSPLLPGRSGYRVFAAPRALRAAVAALRPDRLEVGDRMVLGWLAPWAARHGVPMVLLARESVEAMLSPRVPDWFPVHDTADRVNRRAGYLADTVVVLSSAAEQEWRRAGISGVCRVPPGVDLVTFAPAPVRTARPSPLLVHLGGMGREKDPALSIETLRLLRAGGVPASLVVIGAGLCGESARRQAAGLPVRFLGQLPDPAARAHVLSHADVALSTGSAASAGLAVLQALACGTPVVAAEHGCAAELITAAAGRTSVATPAALTAAVLELCAHVAASDAAGNAVGDAEVWRAGARAQAEQFAWPASVAAMLAVHGLPMTVGAAA